MFVIDKISTIKQIASRSNIATIHTDFKLDQGQGDWTTPTYWVAKQTGRTGTVIAVLLSPMKRTVTIN